MSVIAAQVRRIVRELRSSASALYQRQQIDEAFRAVEYALCFRGDRAVVS